MREAKERGIAVHAVKGGWSLNGSMESKIVLTIFAMIAEIERDLISERTKEGGSSSFCVDLIFQEIKPTQNDKKTEKQHVVSWDTPNQGTKASPTMAAT
jgi:hypothetical protein